MQRKRRGEGDTEAELIPLAQLGVGGPPIQALSSKAGGQGTEKQAATVLLWDASKGMWQLVVLLLTCTAVNSASSGSSWSPGSF